MKLRKWVKITIISILIIISLIILSSTGKTTNYIEILKWLWLFIQIPIYKIILGE